MSAPTNISERRQKLLDMTAEDVEPVILAMNDAEVEAMLAQFEAERHDCDENAVYVETDGPIGHGWECGICGAFLQAG